MADKQGVIADRAESGEQLRVAQQTAGQSTLALTLTLGVSVKRV